MIVSVFDMAGSTVACGIALSRSLIARASTAGAKAAAAAKHEVIIELVASMRGPIVTLFLGKWQVCSLEGQDCHIPLRGEEEMGP